MNWDQIEGQWKQSIGKVQEKWAKLTEQDLAVINGKREQLIGKIQERYGIVKEAAEDNYAKNVRPRVRYHPRPQPLSPDSE